MCILFMCLDDETQPGFFCVVAKIRFHFEMTLYERDTNEPVCRKPLLGR
jgi:hypothetical protein